MLRVVAVLHSLAFLAQPVFAGGYLMGDVDALALHTVNAFVVTGLDVVQLVCAIVYFWEGRGRAWPIWASLAIALAVEVQVGMGFERLLVVHLPLGVSLDRRPDPDHRVAVPRGRRDRPAAPRAPRPGRSVRGEAAAASSARSASRRSARPASAASALSFPRGQTGELVRSRAPLPRPYTVPLPVPPVARPVRTDATTDFYEIVQREADLEILPGLRTRVFGYDGTFPGPTLVTRSGRPAVVTHRNDLPVPVAVHLHGGHTPADSDGYPTDLIQPARPARLHLPDAAAGRHAVVPRPPDGLHRPAGVPRAGRVPPRHRRRGGRARAAARATATSR